MLAKRNIPLLMNLMQLDRFTAKEAAPFRLKVLYYKRTASTKWENTVLSCRSAVVWKTYWKQVVAKKSKHD